MEWAWSDCQCNHHTKRELDFKWPGPVLWTDDHGDEDDKDGKSFWWSSFRWQGSVLQDQPTRMMLDVQDEKWCWCFMTRLSWCWSLWWFSRQLWDCVEVFEDLVWLQWQCNHRSPGAELESGIPLILPGIKCTAYIWNGEDDCDDLWIILAQSNQQLIPWYGIQCSRSWG